jgi:hypothetical protein
VRNCLLSVLLVPALVGLAGPCAAQEAPRLEPSFSLSIGGPPQDVKLGWPIALRVTLTNVSDHDIFDTAIPNSESKTKVTRTIDIRLRWQWQLGSGDPPRQTDTRPGVNRNADRGHL